MSALILVLFFYLQSNAPVASEIYGKEPRYNEASIKWAYFASPVGSGGIHPEHLGVQGGEGSEKNFDEEGVIIYRGDYRSIPPALWRKLILLNKAKFRVQSC